MRYFIVDVSQNCSCTAQCTSSYLIRRTTLCHGTLNSIILASVHFSASSISLVALRQYEILLNESANRSYEKRLKRDTVGVLFA